MLFTTRLRYGHSAPSLDHFVFKLCYRWTVILLVAFSFVMTCRLLFGNSFSCTAAGTDPRLPADYVNARCYDDAVYTLPTKLIVAKRHKELHDEDDTRRYQSYYSWANLLLLVHAFNFYLPHLLWESYERGRVHRLTAGIQNFSEGRDLELCHLAKYVLVTRGGHRLYAMTYVALEILNCVVSLAQALWLVHFFGVTGVPDFLEPHALGTWSDFRNFYFPPEGICELKAPGAASSSSSGGVERYTVLCHLPLNALYMNMFLFLYAWYVSLAALCGLVPVYRILLLVPPLRMFAAVRLSSPNPLIERPVLLTVCDKLSYSDWFFVFSRLQRAMSDVDFAEMLDKIALALCQGDESRQTYAYKRSLTTLEDAATKEDSDIITDMISPV